MNKKLLATILAFSIVFSLFSGLGFSSLASDKTYTYGKYEYTVKNGEATITALKEEVSGKITLPSKIKGYTVTRIDEAVFYYCKSITGVVLPDSVKTIGRSAFLDCVSLEWITMGKSVKTVEKGAFDNCPALTNVYYVGTYEDESKLFIDDDNVYLTDADWEYNCFFDVDYESWYAGAVRYVSALELMKGYGNDYFGTSDSILRRDFVVILSRLSGDDIGIYSDKLSFKDVQLGAYYSSALAWAKSTGVSSGYLNGSFGVNDKITREQIVTLLYNYAKKKGENVSVTPLQRQNIYAQYSGTDLNKVSQFALDATYWAISRGIISGQEKGGKKYIAPKDNAKRCEVAAMFYNIVSNDIFLP